MNHPTMSITAFDVGLSCTGAACIGYDSGEIIRVGTIETSDKHTIVERLAMVSDGVLDWIDDGTDVALEDGISYRSGLVTRRLAMAWGVVAVTVYDRLGIEPAAINVKTVKTLATGNGNADKHDVTRAAIQRWGPAAAQHDIADALWVAEALRLDLHARFPEVEG